MEKRARGGNGWVEINWEGSDEVRGLQRGWEGGGEPLDPTASPRSKLMLVWMAFPPGYSAVRKLGQNICDGASKKLSFRKK